MTEQFLILEKIFFLFVLIMAGYFLGKYKFINQEGEKVLSKLLVDFFWPCLIFYSIVNTLTIVDITKYKILPLYAILTGLTGFTIGYIIVKIFKYTGDQQKIFLYHSTVNNFIFMALPFSAILIPDHKGPGLLFIHNTGYILLMWTLGIYILNKGNLNRKQLLLKIISPGLLSTFAALLFIIFNFKTSISRNPYSLRIFTMILDILKTTGSPTIVIAMLLAGSQIYKLGKNAFKFNKWNILLGTLRLILVPLILFLFLLLILKIIDIDKNIIIIFCLVNLMPVSVNSVSLAVRYKSSPELAAQGIVFTHIFAIITIPIGILLLKNLIL